ncbi:hypothetical protein PIB30_059139 [Stylosanthes scabra]|uniref:Uncharacterized protein n=1 Tax=Stylosanthes scabra TaxID=79078 RepID=A0ABU6WKV2_9FABA|nr:hypothetical protein [Stylosanthes scabra]
MPEYPPWFDPLPEPIIPDQPIPAAPPPSPKVIELSSDESSGAWIDQMMAEMYWTPSDSGGSGSSSGSSSSVSVVSDGFSSQLKLGRYMLHPSSGSATFACLTSKSSSLWALKEMSPSRRFI